MQVSLFSDSMLFIMLRVEMGLLSNGKFMKIFIKGIKEVMSDILVVVVVSFVQQLRDWLSIMLSKVKNVSLFKWCFIVDYWWIVLGRQKGVRIVIVNSQ